MFRSMFPQDIFSEMDRLHRDLQNVFERGSSIRGTETRNFPAVNIANSADAVDIYVFAPGLDPARIELTAEPGALSIAGERSPDLPPAKEQVNIHVNERFAGRFRRVIGLADGADINSVAAEYQDGILHVSVKRSAAQQTRHIAVQ